MDDRKPLIIGDNFDVIQPGSCMFMVTKNAYIRSRWGITPVDVGDIIETQDHINYRIHPIGSCVWEQTYNELRKELHRQTSSSLSN